MNSLQLRVTKKGYSCEGDANSFQGERLAIVSEFGDKTRYALDFLSDFPRKNLIGELYIGCDISSLEPLACFPNLHTLTFGNNGARQAFDLSPFAKLKTLSVTGEIVLQHAEGLSLDALAVAENKSFSFDSISPCLRSLYLRKVKTEMTVISRFQVLENLSLIQLPIQSLDGMGELRRLKQCEIAYCQGLRDYRGLRTCSSLEELELSHVKGVVPEDLIGLTSLRKLILAVGEIPSIAFLRQLPNLKFFSFVGTNVLDGDLTPCLQLEYAGTLHRRHYNLKDDQLPGHGK